MVGRRSMHVGLYAEERVRMTLNYSLYEMCSVNCLKTGIHNMSKIRASDTDPPLYFTDNSSDGSHDRNISCH